MHTQNLTQAEDLGSYARSIQSRILLANIPRVSGKRGTLAWIADVVQLRKALFCFVLSIIGDIITNTQSEFVLLSSTIDCVK